MMLEKGLDQYQGIDDDIVIDATDIQHRNQKQQSDKEKGITNLREEEAALASSRIQK